jgi:hypothetical protein
MSTAVVLMVAAAAVFLVLLMAWVSYNNEKKKEPATKDEAVTQSQTAAKKNIIYLLVSVRNNWYRGWCHVCNRCVPCSTDAYTETNSSINGRCGGRTQEAVSQREYS